MKRRREEHVCERNSKHHESIQAKRDRGSFKHALSYFRLVKEVFKDNQEVYNNFAHLMCSYRKDSIDVPELVEKVRLLFKDHHDLFVRFIAFLPKAEYEIEAEEPLKRPVDFEQATKFVHKVKARFCHDKQPYLEFLNILYKYREGKLSNHGIYGEVALVFRSYPDLMEEFKRFLPEINVTYIVRQFKSSPIMPPQVEWADKREMEEHCASLEEDNDPKYRPCITTKHDLGCGKDKHSSKEKCDGVENTLPDKNGVDLRVNSGNGSRDAAQSNFPRPLTEGGAINFLQKKVDFLTIIKGNLPKKENFQKFLNHIYLHSDDLIACEDLDVLVGDVFQDCSELISGFNDLMNECRTAEMQFLSSRQQGHFRGEGSKWDAEQLTCFFKKSEKGDNDILTSVRGKSATQGNTQCAKNVEVERKKEQEKASKKHASRDVLTHKSSHVTNCTKYFNKPVSDLDLSKCEQCTPSYRLFPEDYPQPKVGSRALLDHAVLNDTWVSVTYGKEQYSTKQKRKNKYEQALFQCEDDRYELDMLLESFRAAIRKLEELLEEVKNSDTEEEVDIFDYLTANSVRCIERIYDEHGLDVLDLLRQNPVVALPVILNRLKQKQDEYLKCQADMSKIWAEVFVRNYHKALDQRSHHCKQDHKSLSTNGTFSKELFV